MILPPTSEISHQHNDLANITMSPTSLSPISKEDIDVGEGYEEHFMP